MRFSILYFLLGEGDSDYIYRGTTEFHGINDHKRLEFRSRKREGVLGQSLTTPQNVFPEYYLIQVERFQDQIRHDIDKWVYFFKTSEIKPEFKSKNIQKAKEKLDLLKMTPEQRQNYKQYRLDRACEREALLTARVDGLDEGWEKGREEGRAEGLEKGRAEGAIQKATQIVERMWRTGRCTAEMIAEATEIPLEQVQEVTRTLGA